MTQNNKSIYQLECNIDFPRGNNFKSMMLISKRSLICFVLSFGAPFGSSRLVHVISDKSMLCQCVDDFGVEASLDSRLKRVLYFRRLCSQNIR